MSKSSSKLTVVGVLLAGVVFGAAPAFAEGPAPDGYAAPAPPPRRTKAEIAAAVASCAGDELCVAAVYLGAAQESTQRAIHEALTEEDPKASIEEVDDAWSWLREAREHLTIAQGD